MNAAKKNRLITFVSPFQRCCLTADPVMKYITQHVPTYKATVLPSIMEEGGLTAKKDLDTLDVVTGLLQEGRRKEAMSILKKLNGSQWDKLGRKC